jgi:hypothetical protein
LVIRRRFEGNENEVANADLFGRVGAFRLDMKIALRAFDKDPFASNGLIIGAQTKMDLVAQASELAAVETANSSATYNCDFHAKGFFNQAWSQQVIQ